jgi:hypothetical protein
MINDGGSNQLEIETSNVLICTTKRRDPRDLNDHAAEVEVRTSLHEQLESMAEEVEVRTSLHEQLESMADEVLSELHTLPRHIGAAL